MTIQEAYNKGLSDSEDLMLQILFDLICSGTVDATRHPNPKMQSTLELLNEWGIYYHTKGKQLTLHGKMFAKMIKRQKETVETLKQ